MRRTALLGVLLAALVATPARATTLVRWERTGGFAGLHQRMTVRTDGRARVVSGRGGHLRRFRLTRAQRRGLRNALRTARLADCAPLYKPRHPVADGITEVVTAGGRSVEVRTGADPPRRLRRLLERLAALSG